MSDQRSVCPRCNYRNLPDSNYCESCGFDLVSLSASQVQEVASASVFAPGRQMITEDRSQRQQATGREVIQQQSGQRGTNLACMGTTAGAVLAVMFLLIVLTALVWWALP